MLRGYFLGVSSWSCIHTYVVGYSFITVVHILQHNITRYNIYNPHREKLEERGSFWWSILLIFPYNIILCSADHNKNIFFRVSNYYWKKMESKIVALYSRLCTHYFNVFTQYGQTKYLKLNDSFDVKCCGDKLWWK